MTTLVGSGTQTATVTTEHTLDTETTNGVFVLVVDTAAMLSGTTPDELELRIYYTCLSAGTERLAYAVAYKGVQGEPMKISPPIPSDISMKATLKQTTGTSRNFPWKLLAL